MSSITKDPQQECQPPPKATGAQSFETFARENLVTICAQSSAAVLLAAGFYFLSLTVNDDAQALTALSGISAFLYLVLVLQRCSAPNIFLNLIIMPALFYLAYDSLMTGGNLLAVTFLLHALVGAVQIRISDKFLTGFLYSWALFNATLALLIF